MGESFEGQGISGLKLGDVAGWDQASNSREQSSTN